VAYNLMLYSQRRQLHQAVAEWIEQNHSDNLESYFTLLAHHWTQAAEMPDVSRNELAIEKAVDYLEKAGDQAMQNYANSEAIQFYTQALEWDSRLPTPPAMESAWQRQVRRARWHSRLGLSYYGLGSLPDCDKHVREALQLLGSPIPNSSTQFALGIFPQVLRQTFHRFFPARYVGFVKGQDREAAVEVARLYELMSRIYFYSNETLPIVYTAIRFLNEAEKAGRSPELASAYASMAVLAGFMQLHKLAETYVERGIAVSEEVNQISNRITVGVVTSLYRLTVGKWDEVRERVEESKALCERIGDYRQWGDCTGMLGESAFISGDLAYSMNIQKILLADARRRRSPLHQCWGLLGVAVNNIRLGNEAEAIPMLEEALKILEETPNRSSSIETNGQLGLAYLMTGQDGRALEYANRALEMAMGISPTVYSLDVGYAAIADVYFTLWEKALQNPNGTAEPAKFRSLAEKAIKLLRVFKNVFPIGQPSLLYYQGWYEWLNGKRPQAVRSWNLGLEAAQKFRMRYEEGLIHMKLGGALAENAVLRREHYDRAVRIFGEMDAIPMLRRTRELEDLK
jgi:tetratricopeptide (TPR) repeat protein